MVSRPSWTARQLAVAAMWVLTGLITLNAFAQSYRGLLDLALHHAAIPVPFAWFFPLLVDSFIAFGELWLAIGTMDGASWDAPRQWFGYVLVLVGAAGSVVGNIGHVGVHADTSVRLWAALPPLAALTGLACCLALVHMGRQPDSRTSLLRTALLFQHDVPYRVQVAGPVRAANGQHLADIRPDSNGKPDTVRLQRTGESAARADIRDALRTGRKLSVRQAAADHGISKSVSERLFREERAART